MTTEGLEQALASTRSVLANVQPEDYDKPSPCESWQVRDLVNHIVEGTHFFAAVMEGRAPAGDPGSPSDHTAGDVLADYDAGVAAAVAAFQAPGAQEKIVTLPFGDLPGSIFMGIATTDAFVHGWDAAKATGQSTDLAPDLAAQLLEGAKLAFGEGVRGPDGQAPFGPEQEAPEGATNADRLAAFLGRSV
jgi:uncharacterized protein (TIGR03086 family)